MQQGLHSKPNSANFAKSRAGWGQPLGRCTCTSTTRCITVKAVPYEDVDSPRFEEVVTLITPEGLVRFTSRQRPVTLPGSVLHQSGTSGRFSVKTSTRPNSCEVMPLDSPRHELLLVLKNKLILAHPLPSWEDQKLCIGACFSVAATNGHDPSRRINIQGFCQSVDILFESVADVVGSRGGEILDEQRNLKSGLHEELKLIVAMPLLWGVPPTLDCLRSAIEVGGGIVDKVYHRWDFH